MHNTNRLRDEIYKFVRVNSLEFLDRITAGHRRRDEIIQFARMNPVEFVDQIIARLIEENNAQG